jgi:hypothetical protein
MRYAEVCEGRVRFIGDAEELPRFSGRIQTVEIPEKAVVSVGDLFQGGEFREAALAVKIDMLKEAFDAERTQKFSETAWVRERHADREELHIDDQENWQAWLWYWQDLRNMPQQAGFDAARPVWPEKPE